MKGHNLGTVIAYEVRRTLSKPGIWIATLSVPLLMAFIFALSFAGGQAAADRESQSASERITFTWTDASGLISPQVATASGGTKSTNPDADRAAVEAGRAEAHIDYPADPESETIVIAARDRGLFDSSSYGDIARGVLTKSVDAKLSPELAKVVRAEPAIALTTWADGKETPGWAGVIAPGLFIVLLYMVVLMLGNQMLNITVEEKENRVTEMILTTIHPITLIVGKLVAVVIVGLVQGVVFGVLVGAALAVFNPFGGAATPPGAPPMPTLASIPISDPGAVVMGAVLFLGGFLMFAGLLIMLGSIMPTAKDAGTWFGGVVIMLFLPFYAFMLIVADPHGVASQVLTFFPLTAPVTAMLRNALGTLTPIEATIVMVVLYATAALFIGAGVRLFRVGSLSYDTKLDPRKALGLGRRRAAQS